MSDEQSALAIFGGRGSGVMLAETARRSNDSIEIVGFLNDFEPVGTSIGGFRVVGRFDRWRELAGGIRFAAPLHKVGDMAQRIARIEALGVPEERWISIVDPTAVAFSGVVWGRACFLAAYCVMKSAVRIGRHVALRDHVSIGHDTVIEDFAFVATGAFVGAYCHVGRGAYVGPCASIRENVRVGSMATIGMGAVVLNDVPTGTTVAGNPARPIEKSGTL